MESKFINRKNSNYYIDKIIDDIDYIIKIVNGFTYEEYEKNTMLIDSVCFRFIQISENTEKLIRILNSKDKTKSMIQLKGLRNRAIHDYGAISHLIIYKTVKDDLPFFKNEVLKLKESD